MQMFRALTFLVCVAQAFLRAETFLEDITIQSRVLEYVETQQVPSSRRSIVIYRVGEVPSDESFDVYENNVKFFSAAVLAHSASAKHQAFYIFRVVGGKKNKLARHLPHTLPNVLLTKCSAHAARDIASHIHAIHILGEPVLSKFHSVLLLSHEARGPFEGHKNGAWWDRIVDLFNTHKNTAILGPLISCEVAPHVQTHGLTFRSEMALKVLSDFHPQRAGKRQNKDEILEIAITASALSLGYQVSSLAYARQWNQTVFNGTCHLSQGNYPVHSLNPASWCDFSPETSLFMRWGGEALSRRGFYCQQTIDLIERASMSVADLNPHLHLTLPETHINGPLFDLAKEYDLERWHGRTDGGSGNVCFLVRTSAQLGRLGKHNGTVGDAANVKMDLDVFIPTLMRQTNPNWEAYFFVTDDQPFDKELQEILNSHRDNRLKFLDIDKKFRLKYNPVDAAYSASDEALRLVMQNTQCARLSVTNGDNAYGSEVVAGVLSPMIPKADLVLLPLDTRYFAAEDCRAIRSDANNEGYDGYCRYFEERHHNSRYGFARVTQPVMGSVDVSAVFIDRHKFIDTGIFFNAFSNDKVPDSCVGCQDGTWVETMVSKHQWSTYIAPLNGLKHMVFHGPSPLWCIAAGNVWFDHPEKATCVTHRTIGKLNSTAFDLESFHLGSRMCLRLSENGFNAREKPFTFLRR